MIIGSHCRDKEIFPKTVDITIGSWLWMMMILILWWMKLLEEDTGDHLTSYLTSYVWESWWQGVLVWWCQYQFAMSSIRTISFPLLTTLQQQSVQVCGTHQYFDLFSFSFFFQVFSSKLISSSVSSDSLQFSVFSLMVWGSPGSFGVLDKETRVAAIGEFIAKDTDHDVFLLNDLWMRPDHMTIRKSLPKGMSRASQPWDIY